MPDNDNNKKKKRPGLYIVGDGETSEISATSEQDDRLNDEMHHEDATSSEAKDVLQMLAEEFGVSTEDASLEMDADAQAASATEAEEQAVATSEAAEGVTAKSASAIQDEPDILLTDSELADFEAAPIEEDMPEEELTFTQIVSIVESLLFASDRPVSLNSMKQAFVGTQVKKPDLRAAVQELMEVYADSRRGVFLEEVAAGFQIRTKLDNAQFLRRVTKQKPFRLSGPALEVLSIVAYKQPVVKAEVDVIRGVESGHVLRGLMEKALVCFDGKSDLPGKPMQYATTKKFLEVFGLRNIRELPSLSEIDELIPEGIGGDDEKKDTLDKVADQLAREAGSSYSENEEELTAITETLSHISTSTDFFEQEKRRQAEKREAEKAQDIRERVAVGEEVSERDKRWLERYEFKLTQPQMTDVTESDLAATVEMTETSGSVAMEAAPTPTPEDILLIKDENETSGPEDKPII